MLDLSNITKTFFPGTVNERKALRGVELHLAPGEFVTVIGSNGAGKSTILNMVSGKLRPDTGSVVIDGTDVTKLADFQRAKYIGRVFQDPMAGTAPTMSIEQNMAMALERGKRRGLALGVTKAKRERFAEELKSLELGLENRLKAKVGLLSGGQRQALSLLMATFSGPKILLLDEHTAALDPRIAAFVLDLTRKLVAEGGLTALMVTHSMRQALDCGTRILMMHEGRVVLDIAGAERRAMDVPDLVALFERVRGERLADDALLLS